MRPPITRTPRPPSTLLYYYRARQYSPELRRFVQRDPLEYVDGPNAISVVRCRPTQAADHFGLESRQVNIDKPAVPWIPGAWGYYSFKMKYRIRWSDFETIPAVTTGTALWNGTCIMRRTGSSGMTWSAVCTIYVTYTGPESHIWTTEFVTDNPNLAAKCKAATNAVLAHEQRHQNITENEFRRLKAEGYTLDAKYTGTSDLGHPDEESAMDEAFTRAVAAADADSASRRLNEDGSEARGGPWWEWLHGMANNSADFRKADDAAVWEYIHVPENGGDIKVTHERHWGS